MKEYQGSGKNVIRKKPVENKKPDFNKAIFSSNNMSTFDFLRLVSETADKNINKKKSTNDY